MRGLDWSNERYTRLHHRDTPAWLLLGYGTRCLWLQLLRKMDRSGRIDLDDSALPFESVAVMLPGSDPSQVEKQLEELIKKGWLIHNRMLGCLIDAEYEERDNAKMSDAQRQRESRARRREAALSQTVTEASRDVTEPSHAVTAGHTESHAVTPSLPPSDPSEEAAVAARDNGKPKRKPRVQDLSYPAELLQAVPDFQERWLESRRIRRLGKKTTLSAEQKQIDKLAEWAVRYGPRAVLDEVEKANLGGYQGLCFKPPGLNKPVVEYVDYPLLT